MTNHLEKLSNALKVYKNYWTDRPTSDKTFDSLSKFNLAFEMVLRVFRPTPESEMAFLGSTIKVKSPTTEERQNLVTFYAILHKYPKIDALFRLPRNSSEEMKTAKNNAIKTWQWLQKNFSPNKFAKEFNINLNGMANYL